MSFWDKSVRMTLKWRLTGSYIERGCFCLTLATRLENMRINATPPPPPTLSRQSIRMPKGRRRSARLCSVVRAMIGRGAVSRTITITDAQDVKSQWTDTDFISNCDVQNDTLRPLPQFSILTCA